MSGAYKRARCSRGGEGKFVSAFSSVICFVFVKLFSYLLHNKHTTQSQQHLFDGVRCCHWSPRIHSGAAMLWQNGRLFCA